MQGLKLEQFDTSGSSLGESFTNNPAWVLLDVLRRSGWLTTEIDLPSFAAAAAYCDAAIADHGSVRQCGRRSPRFECNLVIEPRWSAAEVAKGIRNGSSLMLTYGNGGLLTTARGEYAGAAAADAAGREQQHGDVERRLAGVRVQRRVGGVFGDSAEAERRSGDPAVGRRAGRTTPNRLTVEFQDEFNEYQQDSLSLVDVDDALLTEREVTATFPALGLPNFDQATRMLRSAARQVDRRVARSSSSRRR